MNDTQLLEMLAATDAYADDADSPAGAWARDAAFTEIERRIDMADTKTREPITPASPRPPRRAWLAAAAAFIVVVVAGIAIALASRNPESPPVQPTTTTAVTTTTITTTTTPPTTEAQATTTTTEAQATTTITTVPPQVYEVTLTWDGSACAVDGPADASVGDTLLLTYVNGSGDVADFAIDYLFTGSTLQDLDDSTPDDTIDKFAVERPPFIGEVIRYPENPTSSVGAGESASQTVTLRAARDHVFTCFGGDQGPGAASPQSITHAPTVLPVGE